MAGTIIDCKENDPSALPDRDGHPEVPTMHRVRPFLLIPVCLAFTALPSAFGQDVKEDVLTRADRRSPRLYVAEADFRTNVPVHEPTGIVYKIPKGWKEIRPHRLERKIDKRIDTILGIESSERDLVASLYWIQMPATRNLSNFVRENPDPATGEYGEEYETLKAVYGKGRVTKPTKIKYGPFDVYRMHISGGPERSEKYDGELFVFEVDRGDMRWLIKARVSFPKADRATTDPIALEVLHGYSLLPTDKPVAEPKRITTLDDIPETKPGTDKK